MSYDTLENFVDALRTNNLLDAAQLAQLDELQDRYPEIDTLACELVLRGFLTRFQAEKVFQGEAHKLLLGQYVILQPIGEGGMGVVFKARHARMKRVVALKVIRKDAAGGESALQRFNQEIEAAAQLSHPNVVIAYDANDFEDTLFFVMEYVDGIDLGHLVRRIGPLPIGRCADFIRQAALGLQHAHERGMVHRDIKPSNLLLSYSDSIVKILDMGLARLQQSMNKQEGHLTSTGMVMGTPDFISPEQARDARSVDIRSDLYSLGCTFYFLLAGQPPFPEGSFTEKLLKHNMDRAQPIPEFRSEVPVELMAIIDKLMAKHPKDRYQAPIELARALTPFAEPGESAEEYRIPIDDKPSPEPFSQTAATQSSFDKSRPPSSVKPVGTPSGRPSLTGPMSAASLALSGRKPAGGSSKPSGNNRPSDALLPARKSTPRPSSRAEIPAEVLGVPDEQADEPGPSARGRASAIVLGSLIVLLLGGFIALKAGLLRDLPFSFAFGPSTAKQTEPAPPPTTRPPATVFVPPPPDPRFAITLPPPGPPPEALRLGTIGDLTRKDRPNEFLAVGLSRAGNWLASSTYMYANAAKTEKRDEVLRLWPLKATRGIDAPTGQLVLDQGTYLTSVPVITSSGHVYAGLHDPSQPEVNGKRSPYVLVAWNRRKAGLNDHNDSFEYLASFQSPISSVAVTPDGRRLLFAGDGRKEDPCRLWDVEKGEELAAFRPTTTPKAVALTPDGQRALTGGTDGIVQLWDLGNLRNPIAIDDPKRKDGHAGISVSSVGLSGDGRRALTGDYEGKSFLWDLEARKVIYRFGDAKAGDKVDFVALSGDEARLMMIGTRPALGVWNVRSPDTSLLGVRNPKSRFLAATFVGDDHDLFVVAVHADGRLVRFALPFLLPPLPVPSVPPWAFLGGVRSLEGKPD